MDAFDADVLIYAAAEEHPLGRRVRALFATEPASRAGGRLGVAGPGGPRSPCGTADAVHLATALVAGADRFVTNNRRDFPETLTDITVTYPDTLPDPSAG